MTDGADLNPAEERVEEIRAIRRRLFAAVGSDYAKLRAMGNECPPGFRFLEGVRPLVPLSAQLVEGGDGGGSTS
jgi:hypothetical protein